MPSEMTLGRALCAFLCVHHVLHPSRAECRVRVWCLRTVSGVYWATLLTTVF